MPIIVPPRLESAALLRSEGVEVLREPPRRTSPLRIGLLNLMPDKTATEVQFARLIGTTSRVVELVPALPQSYRGHHMATDSYQRWGRTSLPPRLDGLIVTGAPLEHLPFEDVTYWQDLACILDWAATNVPGTLYICWAAFAALYRFHGVRTRVMPSKLAGVFQQQVMDPRDPLMAGLGVEFPCPVSRHAEVAIQDLPWGRGLACLAQSFSSGLCLVTDSPHHAHYMFNHVEYDANTLKLEYLRDRSRRAGVPIPQHYFPDNDEARPPSLTWREPAGTFFANWVAILADRARGLADLGRAAA